MYALYKKIRQSLSTVKSTEVESERVSAGTGQIPFCSNKVLGNSPNVLYNWKKAQHLKQN